MVRAGDPRSEQRVGQLIHRAATDYCGFPGRQSHTTSGRTVCTQVSRVRESSSLVSGTGSGIARCRQSVVGDPLRGRPRIEFEEVLDSGQARFEFGVLLAQALVCVPELLVLGFAVRDVLLTLGS